MQFVKSLPEPARVPGRISHHPAGHEFAMQQWHQQHQEVHGLPGAGNECLRNARMRELWKFEKWKKPAGSERESLYTTHASIDIHYEKHL